MSNTCLRRLDILQRHLIHEPLLCRNVTRQETSAAESHTGKLLFGKVAIITGAGKGIGATAAKLFAANGAAVAISDLDGIAASEVAKEILSNGGKAIAVSGDITSREVAGRLVSETVSAFGRLDIIINNAGYTWDGILHRMTPEQWDAMLAVHCTAPFQLIQAAAPYMREAAKQEMDETGEAAPRSIINVSSTSGTHGNIGQANYATAKSGIIGLTKTVAKEWGPFNIRCNAIAYGSIATRLTASKEPGNTIEVGGKRVPLGIPQGDVAMELLKQQLPLRRIGSPEEAAGVMLFLACPWSNYMTGQVLEVNGGAYM